MYLPKNASKARQREAQNARDNRAEIVKALSIGQITRRDLFKWGVFTTAGLLIEKHGLSPFARSAYAAVPTGTPRSPLFGAAKFSQRLQRLSLQQPQPLTRQTATGHALFPTGSPERPAKRLSWHTDYYASPTTPSLRNPKNNRGPVEGRPPGETFAHQRWDQFFPKAGYVMSMGQCRQPVGGVGGTRFHPSMQPQLPDKLWCWGTGQFTQGTLPAPLIKGRYGEPILTRLYNNLPLSRAQNGGFGRNEISTHFHNAHNGGESDGASNAFHFPGTFYDYRWSTTLARHDTINPGATDDRASGPNGAGGLNRVPGDFRELQGTMWFHDHRFFFTAENVYKGNVGMVNYYSGPDRGNEVLAGPGSVNLRLPSGSRLDYGNLDFDVNLLISDAATDPTGQLFFDIFDTDGFLGDMPLVNHMYAPFMEVLPRRYRFRILVASMSRFWKLAFVDEAGNRVPFQFIANDGNFVVNPITLTELDQQGVAERYDIVINFAGRPLNSKIRMVNLLKQTNGRLPGPELSLAQALAGDQEDPCVGPILEFRVASQVVSVDADPSIPLLATDVDNSRVPAVLTTQIPVVTPIRTRTIEFVRGGDITAAGQCFPNCTGKESFPWGIKINGQAAHSANANRIGLLIPRPNEVEHWTIIGGSGWDHPIHLHFEEGVTLNRGGAPIPATELNVRKDVWRLRPNGRVTFQVRFGEYGGAYVTHCHNTLHEDAAMLTRVQVQTAAGSPQAKITQTPVPSIDGVTYRTPEILAEGNPNIGL